MAGGKKLLFNLYEQLPPRKHVPRVKAFFLCRLTKGSVKNIRRKLTQFCYKSLVDKEEIGIGGFAVVFTAKFTEKDRTVVVKKLLDSSHIHEGSQSLVKEARAASLKTTSCERSSIQGNLCQPVCFSP